METTAPSNVPTTIIPQNNPTKSGRNRFGNASKGLFYYFAFLSLLASLVLSIIAISKNELTELRFYSSGTKLFTEYCGWRNVHFSHSEVTYPENAFQYHYSRSCSNNNNSCKLEKVGKAWYGLIIIAISLGGIALITFLFDFAHRMSFLFILLLSMLSFLCILAAVLAWGIGDNCANACNTLNFPYVSIGNADDCRHEFAVSWILAVIAGGLSLLSILSMIISKMLTNKQRY